MRPHRSPATHPPTCSPAHVACGRRECVSAAGHPPHSHLPAQPSAAAARQVGDASASQSPLSFGGFGTMLRHLPRLAAGVDSALAADALSRRALAVLQARPVSGQGWGHALLLRGSRAARKRTWPTGPCLRSGRQQLGGPYIGVWKAKGMQALPLQSTRPAGAARGQRGERPHEHAMLPCCWQSRMRPITSARAHGGRLGCDCA